MSIHLGRYLPPQLFRTHDLLQNLVMRADLFHFFTIHSGGLSYLMPVSNSLSNILENFVCGSNPESVGYLQQILASYVPEFAIYQHKMLMHICSLVIIGVYDVVCR